MTSRYDSYFSGQNKSTAISNLMLDIKQHVLFGLELSGLIDDLGKKSLFEEKQFSKKPQSQWNDDYSGFLATGFALGYFSREYLLYCAEVAEYLYKKKRRIKLFLACGIAILVIIGLIAVLSR